MSKFVYDDNHQVFDIEDALTITKGKWSDDNTSAADRVGYFVTSVNNGNQVKIANASDYICGVTITNDTFLGTDVSNKAYCVVQSLGVCQVRITGTVNVGDKVMPNASGVGAKSTNNLGYRVVEKISSTLAKIIIAPNNDMIQRIRKDVSDNYNYIVGLTDEVDALPVIRSGTSAPSNSLGKDGDIYIQIIE